MGGWVRRAGVVGIAVVLHAAPVSAQRGEAAELVGQALRTVGGEARIRSIRTVRFDWMTQWQRTGFRDLPGADRPSFETHVDVRDYAIPAWRNTREFGARNIVNVVRDSVATTDFGAGAQPLSIAYLDERREQFLQTPDRLLLELADAPDLRMGRDTILGGEPHRRLRATLDDHFDSEVFLHQRSRLPTLLRFRAAHPNDYGLVPWGEMEVEVWYAGWRDFDGIALPTQWDVKRVGRPYRRMTIRRAAFDLDFEPDSFAVSSEMRAAYLREATVPMHESRPMSPYAAATDGLVEGGGFGFPGGAAPTADGWIVIGAGQGASNLAPALESMESAGVDRIAGVLAAVAATVDGGVVAAARRSIPILTSPSAAPFVQRILSAGGVSGDVRIIEEETVIGQGDARLVLLPFAHPDAPRSLLAWHAASGWLYVPDATGALGVRLARTVAEERGWEVRSVGTGRSFRLDG